MFVVCALATLTASTALSACGSDRSSSSTARSVTTTTGPASTGVTAPTVPRAAFVPHTAPYPAPTPEVPKPNLTPGAADPRVTQANVHRTICLRSYKSTVRPSKEQSQALKLQVISTYNSTGSPGDYELDHLIPLELGGSNDLRNLWPEPWEQTGDRLASAGKGAESKDRIEVGLRDRVCAVQMTLAQAQQRVTADWETALN